MKTDYFFSSAKHPQLKQAHAMKSFLSFRGSRAGFFSDVFTGDSCPLCIPFDRLRAAVSPTPKPRKEKRPPASLSRKSFMACRAEEFRLKKDIPIVVTAQLWS
jgi:hypothetical protein